MTRTAQNIIDAQGWNDHALLGLALEYIENQSSPEAWTDFLAEQADRENAEDTEDTAPVADEPEPGTTPFAELTAMQRLVRELRVLIEPLKERGIRVLVDDTGRPRIRNWVCIERDGNTGTISYDRLRGYVVIFNTEPSRTYGSGLLVLRPDDPDRNQDVKVVLAQAELAVSGTYSNFATPGTAMSNHGKTAYPWKREDELEEL